MHTKAVFRSAQTLSESGIPTLRFNFRGVGVSTGSYDEGIGEQDDARAALDWIEREYPGVPLLLGGFSFGSMVALSVGVEDPRVVAMVGLGLPVELYDFGFLARSAKPTLLVHGERDEVAPFEPARDLASTLPPSITFTGVPGADHYFNGHFDALQAELGRFVTTGAGALALAGVEVRADA